MAMTVITVSQPYVLSYPPFGVVSSALGALVSFVIAIGFYSMALSVSQESQIRHLINKAMKEANLIGKLGTAHRIQEMEKKVIGISKEKMNALRDSTGIEHGISDENIKNHLHEIVKEMKQHQQQQQQQQQQSIKKDKYR
jgi:hypothetical protein